MGEQQDRWDAGVDEAWTAFRQRLADGLAGLAKDASVVIEVENELDILEDGAAPYVEFCEWAGNIRAEAVSNHYLDDAFALSDEAGDRMAELGWYVPTHAPDDERAHDDDGSANFWLDAHKRDVDRLAWLAVATLREVYGCLHPSFLEVSGLFDDGPPEEAPEDAEDDGLPDVVHTTDREALREVVADTMRVFLESDELHIDDDGDIPVVIGRSVLFVRVLDDLPAVDVYAELVVGPRDRDRLTVELDILNRIHPLAKFCLDGDRVLALHRMLAVPFAPRHLLTGLGVLINTLDDLAAQLVQRVGGRRYLDQVDADDVEVEDCPPMLGLLELMHQGRVATGAVTELFEHDRREVVRMIAEVKRGERDVDGHEQALVLDHLRRALGAITRAEAKATRETGRHVVGGPEQQLSLLDPDTVRRAHRRRSA